MSRECTASIALSIWATYIDIQRHISIDLDVFALAKINFQPRCWAPGLEMSS